MPQTKQSFRRSPDVAVAALAGAFLASLATLLPLLAAPPQFGNVMLAENSAMRISDHVYAMMGFPNIGIVIGSRATLVVDTGLGPRNGAIAAHEAQRLSQNSVLYLTTTHFHPEHAAGEGGFPPGTILIRNAAQQKELEANGMAMVELFSRSPQNKELLAGVKFRAPDKVFDKETTLDLGGVTARLFWMGPAHTAGDEMIFVEPDKTLIPGDIVQNKMLPNLPGEGASLTNWIKILGTLRSLGALHVVPDHGALGDGSLVGQEYDFLSALQTRALELKRQGKSADEAGQTVLAEWKTKYRDWPADGVPGLVKHIYSENP
jgi:glyoxylase-like metal-dependent hydrolase (beta-lactamase superfamily II)